MLGGDEACSVARLHGAGLHGVGGADGAPMTAGPCFMSAFFRCGGGGCQTNLFGGHESDWQKKTFAP